MANFFPSPGSYFEDVLKLDYISDIPINKKETTGIEDYFQPKKGDFDIVVEFPLHEGVVSDIGSQTVRQFFEERNKRVLAVIEYGSNKRAGFIARETIEFDYSYPKSDNVRFTCIGILGELIDYLKAESLPNYTNTATQQVTFDTFLITDLLDSVNQTRLTIDNQLDPVTKFGGQVYLSTPLYNDVKGRVLRLEDLNRWIFFKEICYTFGIKYDLECDFVSPSSNGVVTFLLTLKWRTGSSTLRNFTILSHKKNYRLPTQKKWVMVRDREYIYTVNAGDFRIDLTASAGLLYNSDVVYQENPGYTDISNMFIHRRLTTRISTNEVIEDLGGSIWRAEIVGGGGVQLTGITDEVNVLFLSVTEASRFSVGTFAPLVAQGVILLARLFVKSFTYTAVSPPFFTTSYIDNTDDILANTAGVEYDFLIDEKEKETKTMLYDFPNTETVNLYDTISHNNSTYSIERFSIDYTNETLEADLIEI